jgi:hypothetical protein
MFTRLRSTWLAGGGAVLLALSLSGVVAAAALVSAIATPQVDEAPPADADTTLTFEDLDGDGIDDDCDDEVVADDAAALAAEEAADLDSDGVISTSEAAQSGRIGGTNCNHGGYVSIVAHGDECAEDPAATETETETGTDANAAVAVAPAACEEPTEDTQDPAEEPVVCETVPVVEEPVAEEPVDTAKNAHGKAVMTVAHDKDAVGGKNCNHGGAVSEAAKKDQDAAKAARDEAKAAAKAERAKNHADKAKGHGKKHGG